MENLSLFSVLAAFAALSALYVTTSFSMRRFRVRLVQSGEQLLSDKRLSDESREEINHLLDTCMSFKVALAMPIACIGAAADSILGRKYDNSELDDNELFHSLVERYFVSVLAANLLFAPVAVISVLLFGVVDFLFSKGRSVEFLEQPALRASHAVSY